MTTIAEHKVITLQYEVKDEAGETIDKSSADAPLVYLHGYSNIIPGLVGISLKNKTIKGLPPIVYATSLYDEDLACEILNNGVDVDCNVRHDYGYRPLHYACEYGMVKLVTVILKKMKSKFGKNKTQFSRIFYIMYIYLCTRYRNYSSFSIVPRLRLTCTSRILVGSYI